MIITNANPSQRNVELNTSEAVYVRPIIERALRQTDDKLATMEPTDELFDLYTDHADTLRHIASKLV